MQIPTRLTDSRPDGVGARACALVVRYVDHTLCIAGSNKIQPQETKVQVERKEWWVLGWATRNLNKPGIERIPSARRPSEAGTGTYHTPDKIFVSRSRRYPIKVSYFIEL